jgi:hypothetical protein
MSVAACSPFNPVYKASIWCDSAPLTAYSIIAKNAGMWPPDSRNIHAVLKLQSIVRSCCELSLMLSSKHHVCEVYLNVFLNVFF